MGDSSGFNDSVAIAVTGKIMMAATIVLFLVIIFVAFLHLYAKWFWFPREEASAVVTVADTVTTRRRHRLDFTPSSGTSVLRHGLDPSLLKSLPTVIFNAKEFKDGLECAVCLSELADGENARLLPKCNHGFHLDCIDMWFQSHSTCPLCRNPVSSNQHEFQPRPENPSAAVGASSTETPNFPTNVLFWGNQIRVSTLGVSMEEDRQAQTTSSSQSSSSTSSTSNSPDGCLLIDIPRHNDDEEEETKSPATTRLRSLRRLLSRDRRFNPFSPSADPEQQISRGQS